MLVPKPLEAGVPATNDYYQALGVSRGASEDEIRKAHRRLVRKYHPDVNPGDKSAETRFKAIQEAYDILSEPKKKQMYDQYGFYSESGFPQGGAAGYPPPGMDFSGFDFSDLFSQMGGAAGGAAGAAGHRAGPGGPRPEPGGGAFKDIFSQFFGKGGQQNPEARPDRGSDLEYSLNVDFWQAIKGAQVRLNINRQEACGTCGGSGSSGGRSAICAQCNGSGQVTQVGGKMRFNLSCPRCNGSGRLSSGCPTCAGEGLVARQDPVEVRIPQGVWTGDRLRVAGKGNAGKGVPGGDLFITIRVDAHSFYRREGDNIEITIPVTVAEAGLGAEIEVPTIDGRARLKVPQGTESGKRFRLREKGVFNARKNTRGDQIVEIQVQTPKVENVRVRELLREMAQLDSTDPRAALWEKV